MVSERLGHSGVGITPDRCSHLLPGLQEEAAARMLTGHHRVAMFIASASAPRYASSILGPGVGSEANGWLAARQSCWAARGSYVGFPSLKYFPPPPPPPPRR